MKSANSETYKLISALRREIALSDDPAEKELKTEEVARLKAELVKAGKKDPVIVPHKKVPTVGDKLEKKVAAAGKKKGARLGENRVRL